MSASGSRLPPALQRLSSKVDGFCPLKLGRFYSLSVSTSRYLNRYLVSLGVVAAVHSKHVDKHRTLYKKPCIQHLTSPTPFRTFASRGKIKSRTSYYDTLGVTPKVTRAQIKSAYYKLSKIYHPDRSQGNPAAAGKFSEINEAYSVLSNVALRKRYDNGIYSPRDLTHGVRDEPPMEKKRKKVRNTRSEVYNDQGERMYDFDEYFRAHYGEALHREQQERKRKKKLQKEFENVQQLKKNNVALIMSFAFISLIIGFLVK